jgi:hypothetical protein
MLYGRMVGYVARLTKVLSPSSKMAALMLG